VNALRALHEVGFVLLRGLRPQRRLLGDHDAAEYD